MQLTLSQTINKTCLIGLSYFDNKQNLLKQTMLAGTVTAVDKEMGITVELLSSAEQSQDKAKSVPSKPANFILPANLSCWFIAPKGDFHTSQAGVKITNPDYLITWDIYQTKAQKTEQENNGKPVDGEQQWWQWQPRTQPPQIG
ncbi:hypothetical protein RI844_11250 [Thalassotalea fonticola]|uniref:DUF1842 domain-containing protein n=1 Tax=Thalassotalea fonticola TaxID=3065649 RepID=A0ABZ0GJK4_9GAMM|nr:hypothetical protein RI844_11250 [Colwelliaceae bacterium S1-1]